MKNYYNILFLSDNADKQQISEAYKKLAQKFHPDKNPDDAFYAMCFKEINDANQVLTNEEKRSEYDYDLINYADAYELLKQQQAEENFNRNERKARYRKSAIGQNKIWWMGLLALIVISIILFSQREEASVYAADKQTENFEIIPNDSDGIKPGSNMATAKTVATKKEGAPADKRYTFQANEILDKELKTSVTKPTKTSTAAIKPVETKPVEKIKPSQISDLKEPVHTGRQKASLESVPVLVKQNVAVEERALSDNEIEKVLQQLKAAKNVSCVSIVQTSTSNIKKDFFIASILQQHGYVISGRQLTTTNHQGITWENEGNCKRLIIGTL